MEFRSWRANEKMVTRPHVQRRGAWRLGIVAILALAVSVAATPKSASAATTITVNTTSDEAVTDGKCSLREAINNANAGTDTSGGDCAPGSSSGSTIDLSSTSGTITLVTALPLITANVTIIGPGAANLIIDANGNFDVFNVRTVTAAISGLTLSGGAVFGGIVNGGALTVQNTTISGNHTTNDGGGIYNFGTLSLNDSTVSGNTGFPAGGGIENDGTLSITNSTISGNGGVLFGGGIENTFGTVSITNSTVSGNTATLEGGGIGNNTGNLSIQNATISGNSASSGGGILTNSPISLSNTIVADQNAGADCGGYPVINDQGYNLDGGTSCGFSSANHSLSNTNPLLDPAGLKDNGGPTQTISLQPGSPAIDAIPPGVNGCGTTTTTDQRDVSRPQGSACDIGAFELAQPGADLSITNSGTPNPVVSGNRLTYTLAVTNNGPEDATGVTVTDPLLDNVHFDSFASTQGGCTRSATTKPLPKGGTITCSLGNLASSSSASVTIVVTATTPGTLTNTATVAGNETDPNPLNNSSTATTMVFGT